MSKLAGFSDMNELIYSKLMYYEQNSVSECIVDHDWLSLPIEKEPPRLSFDAKHLQHIVPPINNSNQDKVFSGQLLSPFQPNLCFMQENDKLYSSNQPSMESFDFEYHFNNEAFDFEDNTQNKPIIANKVHTDKTKTNNLHSPIFRNECRFGKKHSKGLRNLSLNVYKIVLELKITTYKEVAAHLLRMFNQGEFGPVEQQKLKEKDEQNIKRRVYDAFNVLISADVLKKSGKFVTTNEQLLQSDKILKKSKTVFNLSQQILKTENCVLIKRESVEFMRKSKQTLQSILKRNRNKKHTQGQKIALPFVGISCEKQLPKLVQSESASRLTFPISNTTEVFGDLCLLTKVRIDTLNQSIQQFISRDGKEENEYATSAVKAELSE